MTESTMPNTGVSPSTCSTRYPDRSVVVCASSSTYLTSVQVVLAENLLMTTPPGAPNAGAVSPVRARAAMAVDAERAVRARKKSSDQGGDIGRPSRLCLSCDMRNPLTDDRSMNASMVLRAAPIESTLVTSLPPQPLSPLDGRYFAA